MKRKIVYGLIALGACISAFVAGLQTGGAHVAQQRQLRDAYLAALNAIAAYSAEADIAQAIEARKASRALCLVHIQASTQVNRVQACLNSDDCRQMIESDVLKMAPELLGQGNLRIKYYKEGELCKP